MWLGELKLKMKVGGDSFPLPISSAPRGRKLIKYYLYYKKHLPGRCAVMNQQEISISCHSHDYPYTTEQQVMEEREEDVGEQERVCVCADKAWAQRGQGVLQDEHEK